MAQIFRNETHELIGSSPATLTLRDDIVCASRTDGKVLITGESGSGKEIAARLIHERSSRSRVPLVTLNCAGLPETLLESELFGHARGSFTGAYRDKPGLLELANRGTVFLDEIGEMSLRMQGMLLRFLETGEIQRIGATRTEASLDVRIVAATNRDLSGLVEQGSFRQDLYYRLNVLHIIVPPLRHRREDIPELVQFFLGRMSEQYRIQPPVLTPEAIARLTAYDWPGNIRELRNVLERLIARHRTSEVGLHDLPRELQERQQLSVTLTPAVSDTVDQLYARMVEQRQSFWSIVYPPFIARDLTRDALQAVVARGLEHTRGNYRMVVELFNMPAEDYKRFLNFLRKYHCHVPFQSFRGPAPRGASARVLERMQDVPVPVGRPATG